MNWSWNFDLSFLTDLRDLGEGFFAFVPSTLQDKFPSVDDLFDFYTILNFTDLKEEKINDLVRRREEFEDLLEQVLSILDEQDPESARIVSNAMRIHQSYFPWRFITVAKDEHRQAAWAQSPENCLDDKRRVRMNFTRMLNKINEDLRRVGESESEIDNTAINWVGRALALLNGGYDFDIVEGRAIVDQYMQDDWSCMSGKARLVQFYGDNPGKIRMVLIKKDGRVVGRAILWDTDKGPYVDRVYPNSFPQTRLIKYFAETQGYLYYSSENNPPDMVVRKLRFNGACPYMDTFAYGRVYGVEITISPYEGRLAHYPGNLLYLQRTGGVYPVCDLCGEFYDFNITHECENNLDEDEDIN